MVHIEFHHALVRFNMSVQPSMLIQILMAGSWHSVTLVRLQKPF